MGVDCEDDSGSQGQYSVRKRTKFGDTKTNPSHLEKTATTHTCWLAYAGYYLTRTTVNVELLVNVLSNRPVLHVCTGTSGSEILDGTPARPGHGSMHFLASFGPFASCFICSKAVSFALKCTFREFFSSGFVLEHLYILTKLIRFLAGIRKSVTLKQLWK